MVGITSKMMEEIWELRKEQKEQGIESKKEREMIKDEMRKIKADVEEREVKW